MSVIEKTYPIAEKLIANALELTQQLQLQLEQEAENLKTGQQPSVIDAIAANKKKLVTELEQFNSQLSQLLDTESLANTQQGLEEYFQRAAITGLDVNQTKQNWSQLMTICAQCRTLNDQNGASIDLLSRHSKRALHILKGKPEFTNTYGPDGARRSDSITHTLISV